MKILVFYTPRSKSTMVYTILKNKFKLADVGDVLTLSRIANQNFTEYDSLINRINNSQNICVKMNGNDFIDLKNKCVNYDYKKIDFSSFDKIVFITRKNYINAALSYAYMNPADQSSWHRKKGEVKVGQSYTINPTKLFYLFRGYFLYETIKNHIYSQVNISNVHEYEYETVEDQLVSDFNLSSEDFKIELEPNNLDYTKLATNYNEILDLATTIYNKMAELPINDIDNNKTFFWEDTKIINNFIAV